jgi:hypothetical protein
MRVIMKKIILSVSVISLGVFSFAGVAKAERCLETLRHGCIYCPSGAYLNFDNDPNFGVPNRGGYVCENSEGRVTTPLVQLEE